MRTDDGYIIHRCLNGDPEAFGVLVDRYKEGIYAYVRNKLRDWHDAQDVSQEVFIQAYRKLHTLKRWDSFSGWLFRIASNYCKNWQLSKSKRPDSEYTEDQDPAILDKPSIESHRDNQMIESVHEALSSLPETYREVLTLYYFGNMDSNKIAEILSTSPVAIRHRLSRARAQLKEEVLAVMSATFQQERLKAGFTFRIVEAVRRIKIHPNSQAKGLPWGISLATGLIATVLAINPHFIQSNWNNISSVLSSSSEAKVLEVGEFPVNIIKTSQIPNISKGIEDGKGNNPTQANMQKAFFMAPQGEGGEWVKKADMPTIRTGLSSSTVNEKIYAIGGEALLGNNNHVFSSAIEEYDPKTDTWTRKSNMPTARNFLSTSAVSGKIYAIGGWAVNVGVFSTVEEYDPMTDTWIKKADMPTPRAYLSASTVNEKIYAIGGAAGPDENVALAAVEEYDPKTDTWTKKADMPTARHSLSTSAVNGKIYAIGGWGPNVGVFSTVEEYDPMTDTWIKKADMPTGRCRLSTIAVNGKIYAIGGHDGNTPISIVEEYDPNTDTWTKKVDMPTATYSLSTSAVNGKIYAIGGEDNTSFLSTVEEYTPEGWPFAVSSHGKLPSRWGRLKTK